MNKEIMKKEITALLNLPKKNLTFVLLTSSLIMFPRPLTFCYTHQYTHDCFMLLLYWRIRDLSEISRGGGGGGGVNIFSEAIKIK